jgi:predicted transcriptional regulator
MNASAKTWLRRSASSALSSSTALAKTYASLARSSLAHFSTADALQRTSHSLIREAITQYVEREEKRESFRQDTLKAWDEYRTTGLHVSADEGDAWLAQLEQGGVSAD